MQPIIKTENLSVIYNLGKSSETPALLDADLEIFPGEYIILFGPSGCGKSTLLNCFAGLEVPTKGKVFMEGKDFTQYSLSQIVHYRRLNIGMIFQRYNLIPTLNVLDNIILPYVLGGDISNIIREKAEMFLKKFGIFNLRNRYPSELSGGQQQRTAVIRALMYHPPLLLADEPIGNLDSESAKIIMNLLTELNEKESKTIILVTHDPYYLQVAHRIFHMKDGRIVKESRNPGKKQLAPTKEEVEAPSGLQTLSRIYPGLTETQLKAKALSQYLITSFTIPEAERLETILTERLAGQISDKKMRELLDLPFEKGGLGLYRQTAQSFSKEIENVLAKSEMLKRKFMAAPPPKTGIDLKVEKIRQFLLDQYSGALKREIELERLNNFIKQRIEGKISKNQFQKYLDLPLKQGGVGLNVKTAKTFTKKLELILSV